MEIADGNCGWSAVGLLDAGWTTASEYFSKLL